MVKECIYITDITLHVRDFRQTMNYAKAKPKGRMYAPLPRTKGRPTVNKQSHTAEISIPLPADLLERWGKGELEIMIPKDGVPVLGSKDLMEKIAKMKRSERKALIHRNRNNSWRKD